MSTTIKPRTASVVIYQGDDLERLSELRRKVEIAERIAERDESTARMGDDKSTAVAEAQSAYDAFVDEAAERAVVVEVQALGRKAFRELMAAHPPREKNDDDDGFDVNMDSFPIAFLPPSIQSPQFSTNADCEQFLDSLSEGDFNRLFATAYYLNRAPGSDPSQSRYSLAPPSSDAI